MTVKHAFVSAKANGTDATLVRPSDWNADHSIDFVAPTGLTGATAASRYVGATTSGAPSGGTFVKGDFVIDQTGKVFVCTTAGSPGTWTQVGGSGGTTIQYPGLKPATPTYDFAGAALDGAFSAHSSGGSFATSHCITQADDGSHVSMLFSAQMGGLYVTHSNGDLDVQVGNLHAHGMADAAHMIGVAALDSNGTGVASLAYDDGTAYSAAITTWNYASNNDSWSLHGLSTEGRNISAGHWLRVKRVSGTWTCYASQSGRAWDKTFATRADSVTVDRIFIGMLYNTGFTYSGRVCCDYLDITV